MKGVGHIIGVSIAAVIAVILAAVSNDFEGRILFDICVNYIAAAGLNVLVGYAGQKSLGHAGLFGVGAYTAALGISRWGLDPWLAFPAAATMGGIFGILIAAPAVRVSGPSLAMVTIGFGIVVEKVVTEWTDVFGGQAGIYGIAAPSIGGSALTSREWIWLAIALSVLTHLSLRSFLGGRWGRAMRAVQHAEPAAASAAISVRAIKTLAFVISAVTCALAGALVAVQNQYINSDFINFNLSVFFLVLVLFGGAGSIYGPLLGSLVVTIAGAWLARWPAAEHFAYGGLLLFALFVMPDGLSGACSKLLFRWRSHSPNEPLSITAGTIFKPLSSGDSETARFVLSAVDLFKAYGGVVPVREVSFDLEAGGIHALIGPNGAGKTTLLNLLSGHVRLDRGKIFFEGRDVSKLPPHQIAARGITRTFQNLKLFGDMTVLDTVLVGAHPHVSVSVLAALLGLPTARRAERNALQHVMAILEAFGLSTRADDPASSLAYGLQRRVEIARALAGRPRFLLLDEPAAGLNDTETHDLADMLQTIARNGPTMLLIEHHMDLVMSISKHVLVLDYGQKIAEGTPDAISRSPKVIEAYLGADVETDEINQAVIISHA
jgi:branched-chain amino acid transport system permease protein